MDETAVRKVVAHMARSLVRNGTPEDLLAALCAAAPAVGNGHLRVCYQDRQTAGRTLVICDRWTDETLIEEYLFGDAEKALGNFRILIADLMRLAPKR